MKNQFIQFPQEILQQIKCIRKISPKDKFPCFSCFDDKIQKLTCRVCGGSGFLYGSHPMVQFSEDFIEKKISYLKKQQDERNASLNLEKNKNRNNLYSREGSSFDRQQINKCSYKQKVIENERIFNQQNHGNASIVLNGSSLENSKILDDPPSSGEQDQTIIHYDYHCDQCASKTPIKGYSYHCEICNDYDLCGKCYRKGLHQHDFIIFKQTEGFQRSKNRNSCNMNKNELLKNIRKSIRKIE